MLRQEKSRGLDCRHLRTKSEIRDDSHDLGMVDYDIAGRVAGYEDGYAEKLLLSTEAKDYISENHWK